MRLTDDRPTDRYPAPPATVLAATATAMAEWCEDYLPRDGRDRPGARRPAVPSAVLDPMTNTKDPRPMTDTYPATFELHDALICDDCLALTANGEAEGVSPYAWHPDPETRERLRYSHVGPTPDETAAAEAAYLAAVDAHTSPGWELIPGCAGCEWCRECPRCSTCEADHGETDPAYHDPETDGPYCPGPDGGWPATGRGGAERADYCPNDEGGLHHRPGTGCDGCGWPPGVTGGTLYPAAMMYDPRRDPRRDPAEARRAVETYSNNR